MPKDWTGSSSSAFKQLGASNHCDEEREENDFYATDPKAMKDLLEREPISAMVWEPAVGKGHLADVLKASGRTVRCSDLVDRGYPGTEQLDFLSQNGCWEGDIITNPPYKFADEFVLKALDSVREGSRICMFLKLTYLEGQARYDAVYRRYPPKTVYVYVKRIQCAKNGEFKGTSAVCYAWFVWQKGFVGDPTIKWIAPEDQQLKLF